MTYREMLQSLIRETWEAYDKSSPLRDMGTPAEKDVFNKYRGLLYAAATALSQLDNALPEGRAKMEC